MTDEEEAKRYEESLVKHGLDEEGDELDHYGLDALRDSPV